MKINVPVFFQDKLIYVADYDFNGALSPDGFDFRKVDRLEILGGYS